MYYGSTLSLSFMGEILAKCVVVHFLVLRFMLNVHKSALFPKLRWLAMLVVHT